MRRPSTAQRFGHRHRPEDPQVQLSPCDQASTVYTVSISLGVSSSSVHVLALDVEQAMHFAGLRMKFLGQETQGLTSIAAAPMQWASDSLKQDILTFESPEELQAREDAYRQREGQR